MKSMTTTVTERGQISIPAKVRRDLGLEPGMRLTWQEVSPTECRVVLNQEHTGAVAMLGYARQFRPVKRTAEWMNELRAGDCD
mgnify:CR=1 FL=1